MEYKEPDYEYDQPLEDTPRRNSEMGMKIAIVILMVVLIAVSVMYYQSFQVSEADKSALRVDLDTLQNQTERLMGDLDGMKFDNDTLNRNLQSERHKADSLMSKLKKERSINYSKLKQYEKELGTLRSTMRSFVRQIDSLNRLNQKLVGENLNYKRQISGLRAKTEIAEETAQELNLKVKRGAQIIVSNRKLRAVTKREKDAKRANQIARLELSFTLNANELAVPGSRNVYASIVSPEGYELQESQGTTFTYDGQQKSYTVTREVDYQGDNINVNMFYSGSGFKAGKYTAHIYMDGAYVGDASLILDK